jgi:hypothetical protein
MSAWEAPGQSDEWYTPPWIFDALGCRFDLDPAGARHGGHVPASTVYFGGGGLEKPWHGFVWMNPPFGGRNAIEPWLAKFIAHGNGIALTPDRTSAPWFQKWAPRAHRLLFLPKVRFLRPDGSEGKSPSCGTVLWGVGEQAVNALENARDRGLMLEAA